MSKSLPTLLCSLFFFLNQSIAQEKTILNNEFSIKYQYNSFLDSYDNYFKGGNGIHLQFARRIQEFDELGDKGSLKWGANFGYSSANKIQDVFYYKDLGLTGSTTDSYISFSNLTIITFTGQLQLNLVLADKIEGYAAIETGYYALLYSYEDVDGSFSSSGISEIGRGAIVPKVGFSYSLTDNIAITADFTYNLHYALGSSFSFFTSSLIPSSTFNHFYTLAMGTTFKF